MSAPAETSKLNDAQRAALDLDRVLLVSAGAGAGKTQVLGLRYLAALETGRARVSEILAFTFTEKAATEMRERVLNLLMARLAELRAAGESEALSRVQRARAEFAQNRISTVHGFCHRLLSDYAWEAGLEPHAPVLDSRGQQAARDAAIRRVLLQTVPEDALAASLERLSASVRLYSLTATLHGAIAYRNEYGTALSAAATAWAKPDDEVARRRKLWDTWQAEQLKRVLAAIGKLDSAAAQTAGGRDALAADMIQVQDGARRKAPTLRALAEVLTTKNGAPRRFTNKGNKSNWPKGKLDTAREGMTEIAALLADPLALLGRYDFDEAHERRCGQVAVDLCALFERACAAYAEECAGALDFLELEIRAISLLNENAGVAKDLAARTLLIFVDEYQDTNSTQSELFRLLIKGQDTPGRFFAVGDNKQAIYGFRGSDVSIFNRAERAILLRNQALADKPQGLPWGLKANDNPRRRQGLIGMATNYRSVAPLIEAGNAIFQRVFAREKMRPFDAQPQDMEAGKRAEEFTPPPVARPVELHLMPAKGAGDREDPARRATEADFVAARVRELIDQGASESDIAILVRRGTRNDDFRAAFANTGIPLLLVGDSGLLNTQEAMDCINLLRVCANAADDLAALGVLRSPFGGLSDRELTLLALSTRRQSLIERLREWDGLAGCAPARRFLQVFDDLRRMAGREAPSLLLSQAISALGYALAVGCGSEAEQRLGNLGRILEVVRELQQRYPALASLTRELTERASENDDEPQAVPEQSARGVRLMTVHRSKGLEFKIVIVPDLAARPGGHDTGIVRDLPSKADAPLGIWLKSLADETRGDFAPDFAAWQAKIDADERAEAEEKRILYVAWTRAAQRLILVGTVPTEIKGESWAAQLLGAIGVAEFKGQPTRLPAGMALNWQEAPERPAPCIRTRMIEATREAIARRELRLPAPVDSSLVAPLAQPDAMVFIAEPEAAEFGTVVHAEIERCLRTGGTGAGIVDARVRQGVTNALEALSKLPPAARVLPEFSFVTPQGAKRLDLLRDLGGDQYEIVDYKTDAVPETGVADAINARYGGQLRGYASALAEYLKSRKRPCCGIKLYVCLTGTANLPARRRLVEIPA